MPIKGSWVGLKEANAALRRLPEFARQNVQIEENTTAIKVLHGMQDRVPVSVDGSHGRPAGFLKGSLRWIERPTQLMAIVAVDKVASYWVPVEYGIHARPFARAAAMAVVEDHYRRLVATLEDAAGQVEREGRI